MLNYFYQSEIKGKKETVTIMVSAWPHILFVIQEGTKSKEKGKMKA